jgi:hypothetical protein
VFDDEVGTLTDRQSRTFDSNRATAMGRIRDTKYLDTSPNSIIDRSISHLPYVSPRSEVIKTTLPANFSWKIIYNPSMSVPFAEVVELIAATSGLKVHVRDEVFAITPVESDDESEISPTEVNDGTNQDSGNLTVGTADFEGTVEQFLDYLTSALNLAWEYNADDNQILFSRYVTTDYRVMTASTGFTFEGGIAENPIWPGLVATIEGFLSEGGKVVSNASNGLITITDTKDIQRIVEKHIDRVNRTLSKTIQIRLDLLTVRVSEEQLEGLKFSLLGNNGNVAGGLAGQDLLTNSGGAFFSVIGDSLEIAGTELLFNRMRGLSSKTTQKTQILRTQNNVAVEFKDTKTIQYLGNLQSAAVDSTDSAETQTNQTGSLTLSELETGFEFKALPHITDDSNSVVIDIWIAVSDLIRLRDETSGDQRAQAPEFTRQTYVERLVISNGSSGLVAAQESLGSSRDDSGIFGGAFAWLGGSKSRSMEREITFVSITPVITNTKIAKQVY